MVLFYFMRYLFNRIIAHLQVSSFPEHHFYIYKLTCLPTGDYYIGKTNNLDYRTESHLSLIAIGVMKNIDRKGLSVMRFVYNNKFYNEVMPVIQDLYEQTGKNSYASLYNFVVANFNIKVLAILEDEEYWNQTEKYYIAKNITNPKCHNVSC